MRLLALLTLLTALAVAPTAGAATPLDRWVAGSSSRMWLGDGTGVAVVRSADGAILGSVGTGRIVVFDPPRGARTNVDLNGCRTVRRVGHRTICRGHDLSFSVVDGAWRVTLSGSDIDASAVVRGSLTLAGRRGRYQIDDGPKRRWPRFSRTFSLG